MAEHFWLQGKEGKEIFVHVWDVVEKPVAILQIFHGMAEHGGRYSQFANYLNKQNVIVYMDDHRGHGETAIKYNELGYISKYGFYDIVEDEKILTMKIKESYPDIPIFILGHSFGSFLLQEYIQHYSHLIQGALISGSAKADGKNVPLLKMIAAIEAKILGEQHQSKLLTKIVFGSNNKEVDNPVSPNDYLSRDPLEVKKYDEDPWCGTVFTSRFYQSFAGGLSGLYTLDGLQQIPKTLPIKVYSGAKDPVGEYGESVKKLFSMYKDLAISNVTMTLYKEGRHEMLNEINRDEVFKDISDFIQKYK